MTAAATTELYQPTDYHWLLLYEALETYCSEFNERPDGPLYAGYGIERLDFGALVDLFFWVKFAYATQLGAWSAAHYGPFARNFWGLGKHVLDLPVKLALPFALWAGFYLRQLTGELFQPPRA